MIKVRGIKRILATLSFCLLMTIIADPCFAASKKNKKKNTASSEPVEIKTAETQLPKPETLLSLEEEKGTVIEDKTSIPILETTKKKTFFSSIDSEVLKLVEQGTPSSLQTAMTMLRKNEVEYSENEKVLIQIATELMSQLWSSQKITWQTYELTGEAASSNPYTGAINSAKNGLYDSSTGNTDFFTNLLPALIIFYPSSSVSEYYLEIENALLAAKELNEESILPDYFLSILYEKKGMYSEAARTFQLVYGSIKGSDGEFDSSLLYGRILTEAGNLDVASSILTNLLINYPSDIKLLKQTAYTAFLQRNFSAAEEYVARVLQQTPNDLEFVLFRAKILVEKNDYIHAVSLLDMYSKQDDSSLDYLLLRARVQLDWSRNTTAATETVEKTLQKYPSNPDALMMAAKISSITDSPVAGKYADELAAMVLEVAPDNRDARIYALEGLMQRENWQEAYEISHQLIASGNVDSTLLYNHVKNCIKTQKTTEALDIAKKYYSANKTDEVISQAYIYAYSNSGKNEEALQVINTMLSDASPKLKSYLYYSRSYLQLTEDAALADLRSCLIANPRNTEGLLRLYEIYFAKHDYRKAQYYLRQVVAINPNDNSLKKLNEALTQLIK